MKNPSVIAMLAGMNGAGKSTLCRQLIEPLGLPYINPDLLALEAHPDDPDAQALAAASLAEAKRQEFIEAGASFAFETVLSDPVGAKVQFLQRAKDLGYEIVAIFVGLSSPDLSVARVAQRVLAGGHNVPEDRIRARYPRVLANLKRLLDVADELTIYDNSSFDEPYRLIARLEGGVLTQITRQVPAWLRFLDLPSRITPSTILLP
jgi:predicted ABC-type ATPase